MFPNFAIFVPLFMEMFTDFAAKGAFVAEIFHGVSGHSATFFATAELWSRVGRLL